MVRDGFARVVLCISIVCGLLYAVQPSSPRGRAAVRATATPTGTAKPTATPTATRMPGVTVPAAMMGLVGRDPFFETIAGKPNTRSQDTMGRTMSALGVRWVRIDIRIPADYSASDATVDAAIAQYDYFLKTVAPRERLKVLLLVNFDVVMGVDANEMRKGPYTTDALYGPRYNTYMRVWMGRVQRIIKRYGKSIGAVEVLNEANRLPRYSANGPIYNAIPAEAWAQLTTTLYRACNGGTLRTACAGTPIVLGGLHPRGTDAQPGQLAQSDIDYLAAIYQSRAFTTAKKQIGRWPVDGIGYHPYPVELQYLGVTTMSQAMDRIRARLRTLGDELRPIWVTELGYNVGYGRQHEQGQADFLGATYRILAARKLANGAREVAVVFWFKYEDFPPASGVNAQKWGLVHIPFSDGACVGGACYRVSGQPSVYRKAWYVYRDLSVPKE